MCMLGGNSFYLSAPTLQITYIIIQGRLIQIKVWVRIHLLSMIDFKIDFLRMTKIKLNKLIILKLLQLVREMSLLLDYVSTQNFVFQRVIINDDATTTVIVASCLSLYLRRNGLTD